MKPIALPIALTLLLSLTGLSNAEQVSDTGDQKELTITVYNQNLALVKDRRVVKLTKGRSRLAMREVSAQIRPETALIKSVNHPESFAVNEQNFDFDLLTPEKLLEKYVGKKVGIVKTHPTTGAETIEEATVLSAASGVVLRIGDRIETGVPGRIVYNDIPENLRDRPTLVMDIENDTDDPQELELSYLTGGLSWKADYVVELSAKDDKLDLNGWVTLTNSSGATYKDAKLMLLAGDVHRAEEPVMLKSEMAFDGRAMAAVPAMREESMFEYHLYTLGRPTTIADNQTKQVALLSGSGVPVTKEYLLTGADYYYSGSFGDIGRRLKVGVFIEFMNTPEAGLGMPLPKGVVRVYKKDGSGGLQFAGEDSIDHTPKNDKVRLKLGDAFDVTADKKQTDFDKRGGTGRYNYIYESAYEITLHNAKKEAVTVKVREPMPGDWEVIYESQKHKKESSDAAAWDIKVPAEGSATLVYRVKVRI